MKVSILLPIYNEEKYLKRSLDSLVDQTYSNTEIIALYDEGTKDNSLKILNDYQDRVKIISLPHMSISKSLNTGLKKAEGEIIFYVEGDCIYYPNCIKEAVQEFENEKVGGVAILPEFFDIKTIWGKARAEYQIIRNELFLKDKSSINWGYFYRIEILNKIGGWKEDLKQAEDKDLAIRVKRQGYKISLLPEVLRKHAMSDKLNHLSSIWQSNFHQGYLHSIQAFVAEKYTKRFILFFLLLILILQIIFYTFLWYLPIFFLILVYLLNLIQLLPHRNKISASTFFIMPFLTIYLAVAYVCGRIYGAIKKIFISTKDEQREM